MDKVTVAAICVLGTMPGISYAGEHAKFQFRIDNDVKALAELVKKYHDDKLTFSNGGGIMYSKTMTIGGFNYIVDWGDFSYELRDGFPYLKGADGKVGPGDFLSIERERVGTSQDIPRNKRGIVGFSDGELDGYQDINTLNKWDEVEGIDGCESIFELMRCSKPGSPRHEEVPYWKNEFELNHKKCHKKYIDTVRHIIKNFPRTTHK